MPNTAQKSYMERDIMQTIRIYLSRLIFFSFKDATSLSGVLISISREKLSYINRHKRTPHMPVLSLTVLSAKVAAVALL